MEMTTKGQAGLEPNQIPTSDRHVTDQKNNATLFHITVRTLNLNDFPSISYLAVNLLFKSRLSTLGHLNSQLLKEVEHLLERELRQATYSEINCAR
jgi:hypothetical protein